MRVVHLCQRDDPSVGGANEVVRALVPRLVERGIDAHVLFIYGQAGPICRELNGRAGILGLTNGRDAWKGLWLLRQRLKSLKTDVLHQHDMLLWTSMATACRRSYQRWWHGHLCASGERTRGQVALAVNRRTLDRVLCVSEPVLESYLSAGFDPKRVSVLPNGVDLERFRPASFRERVDAKAALGLSPEAPTVGFVGRLHCAMKGVDDVIRGFQLLPENFHLIVVGDGPDAADLRTLARSLGVAHRVRWVGAVSDTVPCYRAMDVFSFSSRHEPFGLVILEAVASGVPIVAHPVAGGAATLIEAFRGQGIESVEREPEAWADAVKKAMRNELPKQAPVQLASYRWDEVASRLVQLYKDMVRSGKVCWFSNSNG